MKIKLEGCLWKTTFRSKYLAPFTDEPVSTQISSSSLLPPALATLPRHIAIVMDGNGRWAQKRHLPRSLGHREGVKAVRRTVEACYERSIAVLTLFAFSSENWQRPTQEVTLLMDLLLGTLRTEVAELHRQQVRLRFIGDRRAFSPALQDAMAHAEQQTACNTGLTLVIAANYGGRWDITQAMARLTEALLQRDSREVAEGEIHTLESQPAITKHWLSNAITAEQIQRYLCLADLPEPDLFIRTGGEMRISNFLLWQLAYTELYFTDRLWPDYNKTDLEEALAAYAKRQRRFGQTSEQVGQPIPPNTLIPMVQETH